MAYSGVFLSQLCPEKFHRYMLFRFFSVKAGCEPKMEKRKRQPGLEYA
jgi:hypothetical protein